MQTAPDDDTPALPPQLLFLKRLVTTLMIVMIVGFVILITSFVIRINADPLPLPDQITLPEGTTAITFTQGTDWFAVTTSQNQILIYDRSTGQLKQTVDVE